VEGAMPAGTSGELPYAPAISAATRGL
jgi:hypothetical protein